MPDLHPPLKRNIIKSLIIIQFLKTFWLCSSLVVHEGCMRLCACIFNVAESVEDVLVLLNDSCKLLL